MTHQDADSIQAIARELWLERLAGGQSGVLTVVSGSMSPMLCLGDGLRVRRRRGWYWPGSLVIFIRDEKLICHRLMWWLRPGRYFQKGDLDSAWDSVESYEIIGIAREILVDNRSAILYGLHYQYHNISVWLLVAMRDLIKYLGSRMKIRGMHLFSSIISRQIARHIGAIRIFTPGRG